MVLPPYVYKGDWREMKAHVAAIFKATPLACMLYNNPVAYGTDFLAGTDSRIGSGTRESGGGEGVEHRCAAGIGNSGAIGAAIGDLRGVDDAVMEAIGSGRNRMGCGTGERAAARIGRAVQLLELTAKRTRHLSLYRWFLPLLRMDTVPNFVQLIKLVQAEVGIGNARVRPPRLELVGKELEHNRKIIRGALDSRPQVVGQLCATEWEIGGICAFSHDKTRRAVADWISGRHRQRVRRSMP